jgi:pyruvate ferredoxin oxidoreductase beta subunit
VGKLALDTGVWPLKEAGHGEVRHTFVPDHLKPVEEYLRMQVRFAHLFSPRRQDDVLATIQKDVTGYWEAVRCRELSPPTA